MVARILNEKVILISSTKVKLVTILSCGSRHTAKLRKFCVLFSLFFSALFTNSHSLDKTIRRTISTMSSRIDLLD